MEFYETMLTLLRISLNDYIRDGRWLEWGQDERRLVG